MGASAYHGLMDMPHDVHLSVASMHLTVVSCHDSVSAFDLHASYNVPGRDNCHSEG